ncbi:MAG TPA: hypothetical protein VIF81_07580 [Pyrinomonadaceae bacterium]|jgi:hypothetical protein
MKQRLKRIELIVDYCVIGAALAFVLSTGWFALQFQHAQRSKGYAIEKGTKLTLPGQDWSKSRSTLVLVLSKNCRFCAASAPFYRRLISKDMRIQNTTFVAVFPQPPDESSEYLRRLGLDVESVKQAPPLSLGVKATPALILVDSHGLVVESWLGQLPPEKEEEVIALIKQQ